MNKTLDIVLKGLMARYQERVPDVSAIINVMLKEGAIENAADIENDHIAFRTLGVPNLGIQSLEKIFLHYGYRRMDHYFFPSKKLDAYWYAPASPAYPRIFISELRVKDLSDKAQQIIHSYTDSITVDPVDSLKLNDGHAVDQFLHSGLWKLPTLSDYLALAEESEYAAWVIYN